MHSTIPAVRSRRASRRLLTAILVGLLGVLLPVLTAPTVQATPPPVPPVRFSQIDLGDPQHLPILMYRERHSMGSTPEVSFDRNVAAAEIPNVKDGKSLIIVAPNVDRFAAHTDVATIDLFLFDPTKFTYELVDVNLQPIKPTGADGPSWRGPPASYNWDISKEDPATVKELRGGRMHSERVIARFAARLGPLSDNAELNDLVDRVTMVASEKIPCDSQPSFCYDNLESKTFFPNVKEVVWVTDAPSQDKIYQAAKAAKQNGTTSPLAGRESSATVLRRAQGQWQNTGLRLAPDTAVMMNKAPFSAPGNAKPTGPAVAALSGADPGGIDFSTLQLRYLSEDGSGQLHYAFDAAAATGSDHKITAGKIAAGEMSDAFFVWLSLPESTFWVNLNPTEPDRIVDSRLGVTDVGRILLQADFRMKKIVGKLIYPDTKLGKEFWGDLDPGENNCISMRQWIVPKPATVYEDNGGLYIVDAPLEVKMETDYLTKSGAGGDDSCQSSDSRMTSVFRNKVLPKVEDEVNHGADFADLRRVYLSRVAAEWYRERGHGSLTGMINSGDAGPWPAMQNWSPRTVFDQYVRSYKNKEFNIHRRETHGNYIYDVTYSYGGVDFSQVSLSALSAAAFQSRQPGLADAVNAAAQRPTTDKTGRVLLGGAGYPVAHGRPDLTAQPPVKDVGAHSRPWVRTLITILIAGLVVGIGVTVFRKNGRRGRRLRI